MGQLDGAVPTGPPPPDALVVPGNPADRKPRQAADVGQLAAAQHLLAGAGPRQRHRPVELPAAVDLVADHKGPRALRQRPYL